MQKIIPIYFWDKADFRTPEPKRSQPYLTLCIYTELLAFLTLRKCKKLAQLINSFLRYSGAPMTVKVTPIFDHVYPITIKVTFSFPEYVLVCISMQPVS